MNAGFSTEQEIVLSPPLGKFASSGVTSSIKSCSGSEQQFQQGITV